MIMLISLTTIAIVSQLQLSGGSCPWSMVADTVNYPEICYSLTDPMFTATYDFATFLCSTVGGHLPVFHTISELISFTSLFSSSSWHLGIQKSQSNPGQFWLDGSQISINDRWAQNPNTTVGGTGWAFAGFAKLFYSTDATTALNYTCQHRLGSICPDQVEWFYDNVSGICYWESSKRATWANAQAACSKLNVSATLPVFFNSSEVESYRQLTKNLNAYCDRRWVGISDMQEQGTFLDIFGDEPSYLEWDSTPYVSDGSPKCVDCSPWTQNITTFHPQNCSTKLYYFCQYRSDSKNRLSFNTSLFQDFGIDSDVMSNSPSASATLQDSIPFITQFLNGSIKQQLGFGLTDVIRSCTYKNIPCDYNEDFIEIYNPLLGNCFTFNAGFNPKYNVSQAGSPYGLKLLLAAAQSEYTCTSDIAGFRVVIHENNIQPFPEAEGYNIPLSAMTFISISQITLTHLGAPYTQCAESSFEYFWNNYSVEACQRNCFQIHMLETCGCADPRYPIPNDGIFCNSSQSTICAEECLDYVTNCEDSSKIICNCPTPCNQNVYNGLFTTATLDVKEIIKRVGCLNYCNSSKLKTDYTMLSIFYQQMSTVLYTEAPAYEMYQLYADVASILGLLFGIGAVTVLEIFILTLGLTYNLIKYFLPNSN